MIGAQHRCLPVGRKSIAHKFCVGGQEGYLIVGLYDDGKPGELFISIAKPPAPVRVDREALGRANHDVFRAWAKEQPQEYSTVKWEELDEFDREADRRAAERLFKMGADSVSSEDTVWSTLRGFTDAVAVGTSMLLQHGVPLAKIASKHIATRFEPSGQTGNSEIRFATSILDYVFRWMLLKFNPEALA